VFHRPAAHQGAIHDNVMQSQRLRGGETVWRGRLCAQQLAPQLSHLPWYRSAMPASRSPRRPLCATTMCTRFEVFAIQLPKSPRTDFQLFGSVFSLDNPTPKTPHQVPYEPSTMTPTQLLILFFMRSPYWSAPAQTTKRCHAPFRKRATRLHDHQLARKKESSGARQRKV